MPLRALLAAIALALLFAVQMSSPGFEVYAIAFLNAVIIISVFVPSLGKMAIGTLTIILTLCLAFLASAVLSSLGVNPVVARFEVGSTLLIAALMAISSVSLYTYANYRVWQLLGSLVIFFVALFLQFRVGCGLVQGAGIAIGMVTTIPWLVGIGVGVAIRHMRRERASATETRMKSRCRP